MSANAGEGAYGELIEPATLRIERLLPGPIERVWAYLTESELRRKWLAAGDMPMSVGSTTTLVWRNDELTDPPGVKPGGFGDEHSMEVRITELDPPRKLGITWGSTGGVIFELTPAGDKVLLTLIHRRIADRETLLNIAGGWHMHLDVLVARANGDEPEPFWDGWSRRKAEYERRLPA